MPSGKGFAEATGFEPAVEGYSTMVFKTTALGRSAMLPCHCVLLRNGSMIGGTPIWVQLLIGQLVLLSGKQCALLVHQSYPMPPATKVTFAPPTGLEPVTCRLTVGCSAN